MIKIFLIGNLTVFAFRLLFSLINKGRQFESLVEKLCQRFQGTRLQLSFIVEVSFMGILHFFVQVGGTVAIFLVLPFVAAVQ